MAQFRNLNELINLFTNPTTVAIDYVTNKIIEELQMQMVDMKIGLNNNSFYNPTGEFYDAWKQGIASNLNDVFSSDIHYDSSDMTSDPNNWTHGSNYWSSGDDVRDMMPYIIFGGHSGDIFGQGFWTQKRDAFTPTMQRVSRSFNKWMIKGFKLSGISLTKDSGFAKYLIIDFDWGN